MNDVWSLRVANSDFMLKGGHHLPYLEKKKDSLGIVTPVHQRENHGYWLHQEISAFYIGQL